LSVSCAEEGLEAVILAGGLGTRLRGVLGDIPKVMAPVAGRPFLDWLLEALAAAGITRVLLCLGHLAHKVVAHLQDQPPPLAVSWVIEPSPLGTAGALRLARPQLTGRRVLVMNGDTWIGFDMPGFLAAFETAGTMGALVFAEVADAGRYGSLDIDADGRIRAFLEKDVERHGGGAINGGVYLFSAALLDRVAAADAVSLERDILQYLPPGSLLGFRASGDFIDIGTPESLAVAPSVMGAGAFGRVP